MGGGTKLSRTLRAGDALDEGEGVSSGVSDGLGVSDGDSSGVDDEVGGAKGVAVGDSCALATQIDAKVIKIARLTFFVMSSGAEKSLAVGKRKQANSERFLDFARNDKWLLGSPMQHRLINTWL
jgi:hypothetical protein